VNAPQPRDGAPRHRRAAAFPPCAATAKAPRRLRTSLKLGRWAKCLSPLLFGAALAGCATFPAARDLNGGLVPGIAWESDQELYGERDHWARPDETLRAGAGDCEDQAILGAWLLWLDGVDLDRMRLVYGDAAGYGPHMWLELDDKTVVDTAPQAAKTVTRRYKIDPRAFRAARPKWCIPLGRCYL